MRVGQRISKSITATTSLKSALFPQGLPGASPISFIPDQKKMYSASFMSFVTFASEAGWPWAGGGDEQPISFLGWANMLSFRFFGAIFKPIGLHDNVTEHLPARSQTPMNLESIRWQ